MGAITRGFANNVVASGNFNAAKLTGTLPAISGASLTGITAGITMADQWRLTTSFSNDAEPITSNWERVDTANQGYIGSAMTIHGSNGC